MPAWSLERKFQLLLIIIRLNTSNSTVRATTGPELTTSLTVPSQDWDTVAKAMSTPDQTYTVESVRYAPVPIQSLIPC